MTATEPKYRWVSKLDELRHNLEKLESGFPEVSREHIMEHVPLSILAIPGTVMCTPAQIKLLNEYLATACFRFVQINQNRQEITIGNGGVQYIPYALNPNIEYSPPGRMLWFMSGQSINNPEIFKRLCVVQQLEWILWRSKK